MLKRFKQYHDLFCVKGINKTGLKIFELLETENNLTIKGIASKTGIDRRTVKSKLELMLNVGLINETDEKYNLLATEMYHLD